MIHRICVLVFLIIHLSISSQTNVKKDLGIICNKEHKVLPDRLNDKNVMEVKHYHTVNKFNPIYGALKVSMFFYQKVVSPQLSSDCVFEQSCSNYSKRAIKNHGIVKGVLLTADRLTRCIPATENETELFLFNNEGKIIDNPVFYSFKRK